MVDKPEREKTARYMKEKVSSFLKEEEYPSALLFSAIYVNLRLRTLLTERLSPTQDKWKKVSQELDVGFNHLLRLCGEFHLLHDFSKTPLKKLWKMRCKIAHESELWRDLSQEEQEKIRELCKSAIEFLEKTIS